MPKNRPRCHCGNVMKRNGTTTSGKTRWRCTVCGASVTKTRSDISNAAVFRSFIEHCTSTTSLQQTALTAAVSLSTIKRRFSWCWLGEIPDPMVGHTGRIYDQIFLDGTYTAGGGFIVAATLDHVLAWHWCKRETTHAYQQLLERIPAPAVAVIDGGQGAASALKKCWQVCQELGIAQQVGRTGVCFDTAMSESLWSTLNTEFSDRKSWATRNQARKAVAHWIEVVYNRRRRHSAIGMISPVSIKSQITEGKTPTTAANTKAA